MKLKSLVLAVIALGALAGCASAPKAASPAAEAAPTPAPTVVPPAPVTKPLSAEAGAVEVPQPELSPKMLENRLQLQEYKFTPGEKPSLSLSVQNVQAEKPITFELAAEFLDANKKVLSQTNWFRARLEPGKKHLLFVETSFKAAVDVRVLLRLVEDPADASKEAEKPADAPAPPAKKGA